MNAPILYIVVPCYNEQEVLPITAPMFLAKLEQLAAEGKISADSRLLLVDDGSKDGTWVISIAEVTGDIVITAMATGFTNLIDTIGISANTRLSTSTGDNKTQNGYATVGANKDAQSLIHLAAGDVLRIKGVSLPAANDGNSATVEYTSTAEFRSSTYLFGGSVSWTNTTFNIEGDMLTLSATREIYLRISAICTDTSAVIVTINEEIS